MEIDKVEDKRLGELKKEMYELGCARNLDYKLNIEAAKAYAMLCMAENGQTTFTTVDLGDCDVR